MKRPVSLFQLGKYVTDDRVLRKILGIDGVIDSAKVLVDDAASTKVHMADFRITHLPCG